MSGYTWGMATITRLPHRVLRYEERLNADPDWALTEGSRFFMGDGEVRATLNTVTRRLNDLGVPYAVVGGLALVHHGYRRFTEDVDILVTTASLRLIHKRLDGLGFVPPFAKSKNLRDTATGVKVEFLLTGAYPGDGKPKPVSFPDPAEVSEESGGIRYLRLATLVELKLASGLSAPDRLKDLADVQALIKARNLPREFAAQIDPSVRDGYYAQWAAARPAGRRYVLLWRNKWLTVRAASLAEMAAGLEAAAAELRTMLADGVALDPDGGTADDYAYLTTSDPAIAQKYGMEDESELWDKDEPGDDSGSAGHV